MNILKTTEFYTLKGYVLWYTDYMSTKLLHTKKDDVTVGRSSGNVLASEYSVKYKHARLFPQFGFVCVSEQIHTKELFCVSTLQGLIPQKVFSKLRRSPRLTEGQGTHHLSTTPVFSPGAQGRHAHYHTYPFTSYGYFRRGVSHVALSR